MEKEHSLHWVKDTTNQLMLGCSCNDYLLCNKMKTWKQEFLMMVGLYRGKWGCIAHYVTLQPDFGFLFKEQCLGITRFGLIS